MRLRRMPFEEGTSSVPDSGLTGSTTIPDDLGKNEKIGRAHV